MTEQRQFVRHLVSWRVAILPAGSKTAIPGKTLDVSAGGCAILIPANLPTKSHCTLIFEIPSADYRAKQYVETAAVVLHTSLVGNISEYRTGLQFARPNDTIGQILSR